MKQTIPPGWGFAPDAQPRGNPVKTAKCARIAYWLGSLDYVPAVEEIQERWHLSRASAYRYHYFAANHGEVELYPRTRRD